MDFPGPAAPSIALSHLSKDFGDNRVLNDVSLEFFPGSIHALLGANGSGKSTLIKILAGYHSVSQGLVYVHGQDVTRSITPKSIGERGVRFVHQDLGLVGTLSIADNLGLALGYEGSSRAAINWKQQNASVLRDLAAVGLEGISPDTLVNDLGPIQQTLVAISRAIRGINGENGILILDEPTARLPNEQVAELLTRCRALRDQGVALIYVSHRLDEVFALADTVSVLRDGNLVFSDSITATSHENLTSLITGYDAEEITVGHFPETGDASPQAEGQTPVLELRAVSGNRINQVDLKLYPGEIVAVTGLAGSGRSELGRLIFGSQRRTSGEILLDGQALEKISPDLSVKRGIGYVPQDRKQAGIATFDLVENLTLADLKPHTKNGILSKRLQREATVRAIGDFDVRPQDPEKKLGELSGGNQQKIVLGKWFELELKVLVLDEPTYGVDVGARKRILNEIATRAREKGMGVLLLDSDIDLVVDFADRVLVVRNGRMVTELTGAQITVDSVAQASYATESSQSTQLNPHTGEQ